jgi:hypothetical protein
MVGVSSDRVACSRASIHQMLRRPKFPETSRGPAKATPSRSPQRNSAPEPEIATLINKPKSIEKSAATPRRRRSHRINPNKSESSPSSVVGAPSYGTLIIFHLNQHSVDHLETTRTHPGATESTNESLDWLELGAGEAAGGAAHMGAILGG